MRLVSFDGGFGRIEGDSLVPMGDDLVTYLTTGHGVDRARLPLRSVTLSAPIPRPGKILCIGLNYCDHAREAGLALPETPIVFAKFANSVVGDGAPICVADGVEEVDYEAELGVVIGAEARAVPVDRALDYVAGYVCVNDVSSRHLQFATSQWFMGKSLDSFLPMGPWLRTADEVSDPQSLTVTCHVNGELRQRASTAEMIFRVDELITHLSRVITLEPGDVIATGTPSGVGMASKPPRYLGRGDEVTVEISGLGKLRNVVSAQLCRLPA